MESGSSISIKPSSKTGNTIESDSVDIKEKFLIEKTSFNYGKDDIFTGGNSEQTLKSSKIQTKRTLGKLLGKIDFLDNDDNDVLLDNLVVFSSPLMNLVNVLVRKFFAMNIKLDKVAGKSS
ncbi:hypothetical protein G9A89_008532 [Geosiphon pyriformis]|nr:hypothetical protein G9A89_008532 [Geosiphon pyriformis]